jgi:hypothetical protein
MFYHKGEKVISFSEIEKYITPLALAVLIMEVGSRARHGVRIETNNYKLEEVQFLVEVFRNKFDLDCVVIKTATIGQYSIYIKFMSMPTLKNLVLPYLHPSMYYKLGL